MNIKQPIRSGILGHIKRVIDNQWRVDISLRHQHPNLMTLPLPTTIRGDLNQVISTCRPSLVKAALRIVHNRETAEDIVQEALRKAYDNLKSGRPYVLPKDRVAPFPSPDAQTKIGKAVKTSDVIEDMEAWLHTIVRNVALNYLKSRQKQMNDEKKISQLVDIEDKRKRFENPAVLVERDEEAREIRALVETLPPAYASAIRLRFFEEYGYQMIADELHCPLGTVKSSVNRSLCMLGEALRGQRAVKNGRMVRRRKVITGESQKDSCKRSAEVY